MKLVITERKSLLVLTYIILTIMAYYGPNAELLGNIKLTIWQYERPILDIQHYILNVSLLMAVDLLSFVVNGIALWKFCNINVFEFTKKLQKDFWMIFAVGESVLLMEVKFNLFLEMIHFDDIFENCVPQLLLPFCHLAIFSIFLA